MRIWTSSIMLAALVLIGLAACEPLLAAASSTADLFPDPIIARGQGVLVRQSELEEAFIAYKANLAAHRQQIPETARPLREAQLLDRLIITQILITHVTDEDRAKARQIAADFLADSKKMMNSDDVFVRHLRSMGMTADRFNVRVMEQALADAVLDRELKAKIQITEAQVKDFYENGRDIAVLEAEAELARLISSNKLTPEQIATARDNIQNVRAANLERLQEPERVHVSHIFLSTLDRFGEQPLPDKERQAKRAAIEKLLARARAGEDFTKLIELYSEDRRLAQTQAVCIVTRDSRYAQAFKSAAFSLRPGQLSDVVTSELGYHILKCAQRFPASKISYEETAGEIRRFLSEQEMQKRLPRYFAQLRKEARVEILSPKYDLNFEELGILPPVNE